MSKHVESTHGIKYNDYKKAYNGTAKTVLADSWDDSVKTSDGRIVITHVLVRRFIGDPGPRGVPRAAQT